jgi:hypothetical protein
MPLSSRRRNTVFTVVRPTARVFDSKRKTSIPRFIYSIDSIEALCRLGGF